MKYGIFLLSISMLAWGTEFTEEQQQHLQDAQQYLERAEQAIDPLSQEKHMRSLRPIIERLSKEIGEHPDIAKLRQRYEREMRRAAKWQKEFRESISPDQEKIYREWQEQYPQEIRSEDTETHWLYVKSTPLQEQHHIYVFGVGDAFLRKEIELVGGGVASGYIDEFRWGKVAEVNLQGEIKGYRDGGLMWGKIAEVREDGFVYGYRDHHMWGKIGRISENGDVYDYRKTTMWGKKIAEFRLDEQSGKMHVYGYRDHHMWEKIAEFRENGEIYGYHKRYMWRRIAKMTIANERYRAAVLLFLIYGK